MAFTRRLGIVALVSIALVLGSGGELAFADTTNQAPWHTHYFTENIEFKDAKTDSKGTYLTDELPAPPGNEWTFFFTHFAPRGAVTVSQVVSLRGSEITTLNVNVDRRRDALAGPMALSRREGGRATTANVSFP